MSAEIESKLKEALTGKELKHIEFYTIGEKYWVFDEEKVWVLDCGIQLDLAEGAFSFAWDQEKQFYEHHYGNIETLTGDLEIKSLEAMNAEDIKELEGKKIADVAVQWNHYFDLDENYMPTEHKNYMPMEIILTFENGSILQLAAIRFEVDVENKTIGSAVFDSEAHFLVSLNHRIAIETENGEQYEGNQ